MKTQNYSFFLFCKLAEIHAAVDTKREYDSQFHLLEILYTAYQQSDYNNPNKNEHRCMEEFLLSGKGKN